MLDCTGHHRYNALVSIMHYNALHCTGLYVSASISRPAWSLLCSLRMTGTEVGGISLTSVTTLTNDNRELGRLTNQRRALPVHQRGRGEVVHQVQQTQAGQVPPVGEAGHLAPGLTNENRELGRLTNQRRALPAPGHQGPAAH